MWYANLNQAAQPLCEFGEVPVENMTSHLDIQGGYQVTLGYPVDLSKNRSSSLPREEDHCFA